MKKYRVHFAIVLIMDVVSALTARSAFESGSTILLIFSMLSLSIAGYFFIQLMKDGVGIILNVTWVALGTINVTVAGYLAFGETISFFQGIGMAVIVSGLILTEIYAPPDADETFESFGAPKMVDTENNPSSS